MLLLPDGKRRARAGLPRMRPRYRRALGAGRRASGLVAEAGPPARGACRGKSAAHVCSTEERLMECPFCAETIKEEALVCRHCSRDLRVVRPVVIEVQQLVSELDQLQLAL